MSGVEKPHRRHREDPHGVDAGLRHQREIVVHHHGFGELCAVTARREGAISHPFDEMLVFPGEKELAVHAETTRASGCF